MRLLLVILAITLVQGQECGCPRGKDYYAYHHPNAHTPTRAVAWPGATPRVLGCAGGPYTFEALLRDPANSTDAYLELVQEYVTTHLNKVACEIEDAVEEALVKAEALIGTYCNTEKLTEETNPTDYAEARAKTYLLRGYNEGFLFVRGEEACVSKGSVDEQCTGGCTSTPQFYYDINCHSGGTVGQTNCPNNWPAGIRETDYICGRETNLDALVHRHKDPWFALAAEYITAKLNKAQQGSCVTSEVIDALAKADAALESRCSCSPGQATCAHTSMPSFLEASTPLLVLGKYNQGTLGPGACGLIADTGSADSPQLATGCKGGCAQPVTHWVIHSCVLPVLAGTPAPNARVAWPGGEDALCHTIPNREDATLCGESLYGIMARYTRGGSKDAWTNMAAEYIAAELNADNGACVEGVTGALTTTQLTTLPDLLRDARAQLTDNCGFANETSLTSTLGTSMYLKQLLLQSFNEGELGPGICMQETRCYASADPEGCVSTSEYWKTHNRFAEAPRNQPWPVLSASANAIGAALRIDPRVLSPSVEGQEGADWCPTRPGRNTTMWALFGAKPRTRAQTRWVDAMNRLTTALLNTQRLGGTTIPSSPTLVKLIESLFVDRCLLRACQKNPQDAVPSLPARCVADYETFTAELDAFNNGYLEEHPHCGFSEPSDVCGTQCECTYDASYYTSSSSSWPGVDTSLYPLSESWLGDRTEEFTSLVCSGEGGWQSVLKRAPTNRQDTYSVLMRRVIMAWLHVFSSDGCISSELLQVLQQATKHVANKLVCTSSGSHVPVTPRTLDGRIMLAYADALAPFAESSTCVDPCDSVSCGERGSCRPADGSCQCESGWRGERCDRRDCNGHGIDDGRGTCHCFPGFAGTDCDTCGAPVAVSGKSYICRPCPPDTCGFAKGVEDGIPIEGGDAEDAVVFLLTHVPSASLNDYVLGNTRFPDAKGLPLPRRAGGGVFDCDCKYMSERHMRASFEGSLLSLQGEGRRRQRRGGNVYYDSRLRTAPGAVVSTRHETNDSEHDDIIDAIDALFFSLIGSEELAELCAVEINLTCPDPTVSNEELEDQTEREHDRITGFGIAIVVIICVILLGLVILTVVLVLMWYGVPVRGNPFARSRSRLPTVGTSLGRRKAQRKRSAGRRVPGDGGLRSRNPQ